jgi:hypothetical protein
MSLKEGSGSKVVRALGIGATTLSITTFIIMTFGTTTLSIMTFNITKKRDTKHNAAQ